MNPVAELDQLNLDPTAKTQVAAILQALLDLTERDAKLIQAKELKIAALTHELAYYKRNPERSVSAPATRCVRGNLEYRPLGD